MINFMIGLILAPFAIMGAMLTLALVGAIGKALARKKK